MAQELPPDPLSKSDEPEKPKRRKAPPLRNRGELRAAAAKIWQSAYEGKLKGGEASSLLKGLMMVSAVWKDVGGTSGGDLGEGADLNGLRDSDLKLREFEAAEAAEREEEIERRVNARLRGESKERPEDIVDPLDGVKSVTDSERELSR